MKSCTLRSLILASSVGLSLATAAFAQSPSASPTRFAVEVPSEPKAPATKALSAPAPAAAPAPVPPPRPSVTVPKNLEGVVSAEEFEKYLNFQAGLRENPEIKELTAKINALIEQMRPLQARLDVARANAVAANPEMKALGERINKAMAPPSKAKK